MNKITLCEFANSVSSPVLFWVGTSSPTGEYELLCNPDWEIPIKRWEDLEGTVVEGVWGWDGNGNPTDSRTNTVYRLEAFEDHVRYARLLEDAGLEDQNNMEDIGSGFFEASDGTTIMEK